MPRWTSICAALVVLAAMMAADPPVHRANAATLYSVPAAGNSRYYGYSSHFGGYAAQLFSIGGPSVVESVSFISDVQPNAFSPNGRWGTAADYFILASTGSSTPGAAIASGASALSHALDVNGYTQYSFEIAPLTLAAGEYFVAFQVETANGGDAIFNGTNASGAFVSNDGGSTYQAAGVSSFNVSIDGEAAATAVPDPVTIALLGTSFAAVGLSRRRKRPYAAPASLHCP